MPVNGAPAPDLNAALLQLDMNLRNGGSGKPMYFLGLFPMNADTGSSLSLRATGGFDKPICYFAQSFKNRRAQGSSLEGALAGIMDQFKKMNSEGHIIYSGDLPSGSHVSSNVASSGGDLQLS